MSQQGHRRGSHSCFARGKKQRRAVPHAREQQPAGCPSASWALQRAEGRDGDGASLAPCTRTEPARPWNGAGHGGKRKASPGADDNRLAGRQGRSKESGPAPKRGRGAEPNGESSVQTPLQAGGLPEAAGPSRGGTAAPAVANCSSSKIVVARKRKGVEEEEQEAELGPANKQVKVEHNGEKAQSPHQSRGAVPAPSAQPGPAPVPTERFRTSKRRERRRRQKERRAEMKKAALRAAAAHAEFSTMNSLVEMMEKLQLKD
ncbi:uncharacterized protein LOC128072906 [Tympanuchus pallidicinctus]|uniref:uncharacterized protein LOC128072906 n=1 Tax=Tympanuchus pallidicinctus TaxID=109042 RepID=UPI0022876614|nr:uncharacterized protein LOC128072906 [Tympanuchus pallidicinctus]